MPDRIDMESPKGPPSLGEEHSPLEMLLNRYVAVWLWSIVFGASTGLLYSLVSFSYRTGKLSYLTYVLLMPAVLSLIFALQTWMMLLGGLRCYLLPRFFPSVGASAPDEARFAYLIQRSFFYLILASVMRVTAAILEMLLTGIAWS